MVINRLLLSATVAALAACSDPARPEVPTPEVPGRPAPLPSPVPVPVTGTTTDASPVSAACLPAPGAGAKPALQPTVPPPPSPQDQGAGDADTAMTAALRTAIRKRDDLSAEARMLTVTTRDGVVTLRGQVADETERDAVLSLVHAVPEVQRVDDRLEPIVR